MESQEGCSQAVDEASWVSRNITVPEVDGNLKPYIGMRFQYLEEAKNFYSEYGKFGGFDVRSSSTKYSKEGQLTNKTFVCSKEGESKSKSREVRRCGTIRTNCKALIHLKLDKESGVWIVTKFIEEHNHEVTTPRRRHLLRGNRKVCNAKKKLVKQFKEVNIPTNKTMAFLENESKGYNKVGCTEIDIRNYERDLREAMKGHDAQMLVDNFKWHQERNPSFYYVTKVDDENRLTHCFWVDGVARINFEHFGDVVSFDTTHNTNQYGLIFAPFVGLNHHSQTIFLGCGLLPNESADSFVWLFEKWLEVTGHPPSAMVTDQDLGICTALSRVFPQTRHRFCIWHIMNKVPDKLGAWVFKKDFMNQFKDNIWNANTPDEFQKRWKEILIGNDLTSHEWLSSLYDIRHKWIPAYHKSNFWAGMSSSQRSEGMNAFLKMHVSKKNTLHEFFIIFDRALTRQREEEVKADHNTLEKKPKLKTLWTMEKQMAQIYTKYIFYIFQEELESSLLYNVVLITEDENKLLYRVSLCGKVDSKKDIKYCKLKQQASCSCLMFEFKGIPCRHLLAFLKYNDYDELPKQYILRRWSRDVKRRAVLDKNGNKVKDNTRRNFASHFSELTYLANQLVDEGLSTNDTYESTQKRMREAIDEIRCLKFKDGEKNEERSEEWGKRKDISQISVHEPNQAKTKGSHCGKRMKPERENPRARNRKCNGCGKRGQKHDKRNCPFLMISSSEERQAINMSNEGSLDEFNEEEYEDEESVQSLDG